MSVGNPVQTVLLNGMIVGGRELALIWEFSTDASTPNRTSLQAADRLADARLRQSFDSDREIMLIEIIFLLETII